LLTLVQKTVFLFQPQGLWKEHKTKFSSFTVGESHRTDVRLLTSSQFRREQMLRFWKTCLSNALDGGASAIKYTSVEG
jgi:hypothetical protein